MSSVLSFEPSKRIHALIGDSDTEIKWEEAQIPNEDDPPCHTIECERTDDPNWKYYPAYTFAELIRVLKELRPFLDHLKSLQTIYHGLCTRYANAPTEPEGMKAVEEYLMKLL